VNSCCQRLVLARKFQTSTAPEPHRERDHSTNNVGHTKTVSPVLCRSLTSSRGPRDEAWLGHRSSETPTPSLHHPASHSPIGRLGSTEDQHVDTAEDAVRRSDTPRSHSTLLHQGHQAGSNASRLINRGAQAGMMALAVPNPPGDRKRVKVYELRNNDWFDRGTGFCTGQVINVRLNSYVPLISGYPRGTYPEQRCLNSYRTFHPPG
jgi:hypothetical protein